MKNDNRDELDNLIDGALSEYSSVEPMEGLEDRVLRRVHAAGTARRSPWLWGVGVAIPAAAALLLLWVVWRPQPCSTNPAPKLAVVKTPPAPLKPPQVSPAPVGRVMKPKRRPVTRPLPKEEFFPSPSPLTGEERALVAWVQRAPLEAQQAFADLRKRSEEPVVIEPIRIPPLQSDGNQ
jgi:hypothetical protein